MALQKWCSGMICGGCEHLSIAWPGTVSVTHWAYIVAKTLVTDELVRCQIGSVKTICIFVTYRTTVAFCAAAYQHFQIMWSFARFLRHRRAFSRYLQFAIVIQQRSQRQIMVSVCKHDVRRSLVVLEFTKQLRVWMCCWRWRLRYREPFSFHSFCVHDDFGWVCLLLC